MRLVFLGACKVPPETIRKNHAYALSLGLPWWKPGTGSGALAVAGGGPSIKDHREELRAWPGTIWAINGTWGWCRDQGIRATLYSVDPGADLLDWVPEYGVENAILCSYCDTRAFDRLIRQGCRVTLMQTAYTDEPLSTGFEDVDGVGQATATGPTSATAAITVGLAMGFERIEFFGCESSYTKDGSHTFRLETDPQWIRLNAGGKPFVTKPELVIQAEVLAGMIREVPHLLRDRSGGLLGALIENPEWDVEGVSADLHASLSNGEGVPICQTPW